MTDVTRCRQIDGRNGCGAGYRVTLTNTETGYKFTTSYNNSRANGECRPDINDIIYCLLSDRSCYNSCIDFNDFVDNFGYENNAKRAYRAFTGCQKTALDLENLLTPEQLEQLSELYQDF